jgi:hypothetical protein
MSLRPRYSLLTLLVLTALVAGGVKLWYGPHHVVERRSPSKEFEYSYTRDLHGNKIVHGPCIIRAFASDGQMLATKVVFFRHGQIIHWRYLLTVWPDDSDLPISTVDDDDISSSPLNAEELNTLKSAIEAARNQKLNPKPGWHWYEELSTGYYELFRGHIQSFEDYEESKKDFLEDQNYISDY